MFIRERVYPKLKYKKSVCVCAPLISHFIFFDRRRSAAVVADAITTSLCFVGKIVESSIRLMCTRCH